MWSRFWNWLALLLGLSPTPTPIPPNPYPRPRPPLPIPGDPYGFVTWLNRQRYARGLALVRNDTAMQSYSGEQNQYMIQNGFGHWIGARGVPSDPRQNLAGCPTIEEAENLWLSDAPHAALLFDPGISRVGIARIPSNDAFVYFWTMSAL